MALTGGCLQRLARLFGGEAGRTRATRIADWAAEGLTTALDLETPGHPQAGAESRVAGTWVTRLVLGSRETSSTVPGYVTEAVEAGRRAAEEALARLD